MLALEAIYESRTMSDEQERSPSDQPHAEIGSPDLSVIYNKLRAIARQLFRSERIDHTLQPTALVHEALVRLIATDSLDLDDPQGCIYRAVKLMRCLLVSHARAKHAIKRGRGARAVAIPLDALADSSADSDLDSIDQALGKLEAVNPRQAQIVELRFFGGLSVEETARVLDLSPRTVKADWKVARAWLSEELAA
ncbi:MAG: ECF-type sigma factor [Phycisphaerae bacterium]